MKFRPLILAFATAIFVSISIHAQPGCSSDSARTVLQRYEHVFVGRVVSSGKVDGRPAVDVRVEESFRGADVGQTISLLTDMRGCGGDYAVGKSYLFAAEADRLSGRLYATDAFGQNPSRRQRQNIELLRAILSGKPFGTIVGRVFTQDFDTLGETPRVHGFDKVVLEHENGSTVEISVEEDGFYKFTDLMPGAYTLSLELPPGFAPSNLYGSSRRQIMIRGNDGLIMDFQLEHTAALGGRVSDVKGDPLAGIYVVLHQTGPGGDRAVLSTDTAANGSYKFERLVPGSYIVEAFPVNARTRQYDNKLWQPDPESEFPATFYPASREKLRSTPIVITPGRTAAGTDIRMQALAARTITGRVVARDGTPVANADIYVKSRRTAAGRRSESPFPLKSATADANGNFRLVVYQDTEYFIHAGFEKVLPANQGSVRVRTQCRPLPANGDIPTIELAERRSVFIGSGDDPCN